MKVSLNRTEFSRLLFNPLLNNGHGQSVLRSVRLRIIEGNPRIRWSLLRPHDGGLGVWVWGPVTNGSGTEWRGKQTEVFSIWCGFITDNLNIKRWQHCFINKTERRGHNNKETTDQTTKGAYRPTLSHAATLPTSPLHSTPTTPTTPGHTRGLFQHLEQQCRVTETNQPPHHTVLPQPMYNMYVYVEQHHTHTRAIWRGGPTRAVTCADGRMMNAGRKPGAAIYTYRLGWWGQCRGLTVYTL